MQQQNVQDEIRRAALDMLARRDYSQCQLAKKLKAKGYARNEIELVMTDLVQAGLINDLSFAENYIYHRRAKGYGPQRIQMELEARGLSVEVIAELLNIADNEWLIEAEKLWQKRFKGKLPNDLKTRVKHMRFLQYRGFTLEQIDAVFRDGVKS